MLVPKARSNRLKSMITYLDPQIRMHENLELKALVPLVPHQYGRLQTLPRKRNAIDQSKTIRPRLAVFGAEIRRRQTKVERDAVGGRGLARAL